MSQLKPVFLNKLQYLIHVGYTQDTIKAFEDYCVQEVFDEESVIDDLETLEDSCIVSHFQQTYNWNDAKMNDFFFKLRQTFDIDTKQQETHKNSNTKLCLSAFQIDYKLTKQELNIYKEIYFSECNRLLPLDQRNAEEALLRVLSIGRKNNVPLLQNIADTYSRVRIDEYLKSKTDLQEAQFAHNYSLLRKMKRRNQKQTAQYLESALISFHKRICPKIQFTSLLKINDSLSAFFEYISATIKFIYNVVSQQDALPPFQIDMWIIPRNVKSAMIYDTQTFGDDEEESDDDDDDEFESHDDEVNDSYNKTLIGDIESRLQSEKLIYEKENVEYNSPLKNSTSARRFVRELDKKCKDFWKKNKQNSNKHKNESSVTDRSGAHQTRTCIVVDRRKPKDYQTDDPNKKTWDDVMYIYSPPSNCNYIAEHHTPESYFNSSKECILPGKGYNNGRRDEDDHYDENEMKRMANNKGKNKQRNSECLLSADSEDIEVGKPLDGYQFTLSFHVESIDNIKCYLFYQGWIARFFPEDMINVWPIWFSDSKANKEFVNNAKKWKSQINTLQEMLCDDQFEQWYNETVV